MYAEVGRTAMQTEFSSSTFLWVPGYLMVHGMAALPEDLGSVLSVTNRIKQQYVFLVRVLLL